jgi:glycosyltransferase involved in cell wall biosynthesis
MAMELSRRMRGQADVEEVFIERRRKCRQIEWREPPDRVIEHWTKYLAFLQINVRLPKYDVYHFLSERHARLLKYGRNPAVATFHDAAPLRTNGVYTEGTQRRFRKNVEMMLGAQAIVANSQNAKKDLVELFDADEKKVRIIYPGANHEVHCPRDRAASRELLGLPSSARILLNVGNENKNNNIPGMIEMLSIVRRSVPEVMLVRIGPTSPQVDEAIEHYGIADAVLRLGPNEGPTTLYNHYFNASDLYVCLDHYTGYSIQSLAAMASGCPVVSSGRGGYAEIADGACVLVSSTDIPETAETVVSLLRDESARLELAERGLERSQEFTWEKAAAEYIQVYEDIINGAHA